MQPGGKSRLAAKTADFPKKLDEDLLRQVFRFRDISGHAQAERIYAAIVALVKLFEGFHIAFGGPLRQLVIRSSRCVSFDCSHLFVRLRGASRGTSQSYASHFRYSLILDLALRQRLLVSDHRRAVTSCARNPWKVQIRKILYPCKSVFIFGDGASLTPVRSIQRAVVHSLCHV